MHFSLLLIYQSNSKLDNGRVCFSILFTQVRESRVDQPLRSMCLGGGGRVAALLHSTYLPIDQESGNAWVRFSFLFFQQRERWVHVIVFSRIA